MNILVTGATGFIGKALICVLKKRSQDRIFEISRSKGVDFRNTNWQKNINDLSIDIVIHLAQSQEYRDFPEGALDMTKVNVDSTVELLEWSRTHGVKKFIFASTGNVYKSDCTSKMTENELTEPASFYGASKLAAEYLVKQYGVYFQTVILRIFGVYGGGQKNMLIASMIDRVINENEIYLAQGEGVWMTPVYINDCVKLIGNLLEIEMTQANVLYNIAGDEVVSLGAVVSTIEGFLGKAAKIVLTDEEPTYFLGSNARVKSVMNEFLFTSVSDGLRKTLGL